MQMFIDMTWGDINNGDVGPGMFSWFHLLWLAITLVATIIVCVKVALKQNPKNKVLFFSFEFLSEFLTRKSFPALKAGYCHSSEHLLPQSFRESARVWKVAS